jgi:hypothetical protein
MEVPAILLLLLAVTYPVNHSFFLKLRIADFVMLAFILVTLPRVRFRSSLLVALVLSFLAFYAVSAAFGSFTRGIVSASNLMFAYKYGVALALIAWLGCQYFAPYEIDRVTRASFAIYGLLVLWVFARFLLWTLGIVSGNVRVSFPFSNESDPNLSDAPMYSVVLATCLTAYVFYPARRRGRHLRPLIALVVTVAAIILSGSRTGLIAVGVVMLLAGAGRVFNAARQGRIRLSLRTVLLVVVIGIAAAFAISRIVDVDSRMLELMVQRVFNVNVGQDLSVNSRLEKLAYVLDAIFHGPILLGLGMQSTFHVWFDNSYAGVLFAAGLGGLTVLLAAIALLFADLRATALRNGTWAWYRGLFYILVSYLVSAFSSEFFLVTRGLVPFAVLFAIYLHHIRTPSSVAAIPAAAPVERGD